MHYEIGKKIQEQAQLFGRRTVMVMAGLLVALGVYVAVDYWAPEINYLLSNPRHTVQENVKNVAPGDINMLYIPRLGVQTELSEKKQDSKVWYRRSGDNLTMVGRHRTLGLTPAETVDHSPLFVLQDLGEGDEIYLDLDRHRQLYVVAEEGHDLTLEALGGAPENAKTVVKITAKYRGEVKVD
jgi:hypothetical protein